MEIFKPDNFFDMANLITNVIVGLIAIVGLLVAFLTYTVALKALNSWREAKAHDINLVAIVSMSDARSYLQDLTRVYLDPGKLNDFEIDEANIIFKTDIDFYNYYVMHKSYWNSHNGNPKDKKMKEIALNVINGSDNDKIIRFYKDYIFLSNTLRSIVMNYFATKINEYNGKFSLLNYVEPTDLNLTLMNIIPASVKEERKGKDDIEILYEYFTGEGISGWLQHLQDVEIEFYNLRSN